MKTIKNLDEFAEDVCRYVKNALPEELSGTEVCTGYLKLWDGDARMVLLIIRPHNGVTTGFCLDRHYKNYSSGNTTAESAAAAIINDRRLYNISLNNSDMQQNIAAIYG